VGLTTRLAASDLGSISFSLSLILTPYLSLSPKPFNSGMAICISFLHTRLPLPQNTSLSLATTQWSRNAQCSPSWTELSFPMTSILGASQTSTSLSPPGQKNPLFGLMKGAGDRQHT